MTSAMPVTICNTRQTVRTMPQIHIQFRFLGVGIISVVVDDRSRLAGGECTHFSMPVLGSYSSCGIPANVSPPKPSLMTFSETKRRLAEREGSGVPGPFGGSGQTCHSATRGRGRTSRQSHRLPRSGHSPGACKRPASRAIHRPRPASGSGPRHRRPVCCHSRRVLILAVRTTQTSPAIPRSLPACPAADKHRLAAPLDLQLRVPVRSVSTGTSIAGQRQHVLGRVHLVDQRPDRGVPTTTAPVAASRDIEKIPTISVVL